MCNKLWPFCHDSEKSRTNKLEWWMILKISLRAKDGVPKTLVKQKLRLHSLYVLQNTLMLGDSVICILFSDFVRFPIPETCACVKHAGDFVT